MAAAAGGGVSWRVALGVALLLAQLGWVLGGGRPALWAPFHEHAVFRLHVRLDGRELTTRESLERYGLSTWHVSDARDEAWETNDLDFVKAAVVARETEGEVELTAVVNGEPRAPWRYRRP